MERTSLSLASNSTRTPGGIVERVLETGSGIVGDGGDELLAEADRCCCCPFRAVCIDGVGCGR